MDLKSTYKVKGLGVEKTIESVIKIGTDSTGEKITSVEDRWNGEIPEGPIATVCSFFFLTLKRSGFVGGKVKRIWESWLMN